MCFPTLWPWLYHPMPSTIEWVRCSTRPEINLSPAMQPQPHALTAYDTGSTRGSPLYLINHPTLWLKNNLQLIHCILPATISHCKLSRSTISPPLEENKKRIACLLLVDDVVLRSTSQEELQKMMDITNQTTMKYHIEFGKAKSNIMKRGGQNTKKTAKLGDVELNWCNRQIQEPRANNGQQR